MATPYQVGAVATPAGMQPELRSGTAARVAKADGIEHTPIAHCLPHWNGHTSRSPAIHPWAPSGARGVCVSTCRSSSSVPPRAMPQLAPWQWLRTYSLAHFWAIQSSRTHTPYTSDMKTWTQGWLNYNLNKMICQMRTREYRVRYSETSRPSFLVDIQLTSSLHTANMICCERIYTVAPAIIMTVYA